MTVGTVAIVVEDDVLPQYALIEGVKHGSLAAVEQAIAHGANVSDAHDLNGMSALAVAEKYKQTELAHHLIELGANPLERVDELENTLLHRACANGNYGFASLLLGQEVSPDIANKEGMRPLHLAVKNGHEYLVRRLIDSFASLNIAANNGDTALHMAARRGDTSVIRLLIKSGHPLLVHNAKALTPLHEAARAGHPEASKILIAHCQNYDEYNHPIPVRWVAERNGHSETALIIEAAERNQGFHSYTDRVREFRSRSQNRSSEL